MTKQVTIETQTGYSNTGTKIQTGFSKLSACAGMVDVGLFTHENSVTTRTQDDEGNSLRCTLHIFNVL